jgi:hypothetical protein
VKHCKGGRKLQKLGTSGIVRPENISVIFVIDKSTKNRFPSVLFLLK